MTVSLKQVHGNAEVVVTMERLLEVARQGQMAYVAVAMCFDGTPPKAGAEFAGAINMEPVAKEAIKHLQSKLEASIQNYTLPQRADLDASYVTYDVPNGQLSYDFLPWLIDAEMTRIREGAPAPLKVCFWFGRDGKTGVTLPSRRQMLDNVVKPMLDLVGAIESRSMGRSKAFFGMRDIVRASRAGEPVPMLKRLLKDNYPDRKGSVTITLREAPHWPHRNSNLEAWRRFARWLVDRGEHVIFVRDTAKADEALPGFATYPPGSRWLHNRMDLYHGARANLGVSNGPMSLCWFTDKPWLQFIALNEDGHPYWPNTPKYWREIHGIEAGGQWPWARPGQRLVWGEDSFDNLVEAWERHVAPHLRSPSIL